MFPGLIVNLITVMVLSHYCPTAREVAPLWAYALAALGLFIYQTLDATGRILLMYFISVLSILSHVNHHFDNINVHHFASANTASSQQ